MALEEVEAPSGTFDLILPPENSMSLVLEEQVFHGATGVPEILHDLLRFVDGNTGIVTPVEHVERGSDPIEVVDRGDGAQEFPVVLESSVLNRSQPSAIRRSSY